MKFENKLWVVVDGCAKAAGAATLALAVLAAPFARAEGGYTVTFISTGSHTVTVENGRIVVDGQIVELRDGNNQVIGSATMDGLEGKLVVADGTLGILNYGARSFSLFNENGHEACPDGTTISSDLALQVEDYTGIVDYLDPVGTNAVSSACIGYYGQDTLASRWYMVEGAVKSDAHIIVSGDANLILCDGATLTAMQGVEVAPGGHLAIWSQSDATTAKSPVGRLIATGVDGGAGVGGGKGETAGSITINGGTVAAFALPGQFKVSGTDSSQLTNMSSSSIGYALKHSWYYGINAYDNGIGGIEYAVTIYMDSAHTCPVATSEKMLGSGSPEMRRSIDITDRNALGDATYSYSTIFNEETSEYTLNIFDKAGAVVAMATGVVGANCNILAANGGANLGTVTFDLVGMEAGFTGTVYMANMRRGLPASGTTISMATTVQGSTYAQNYGIDIYCANPAFDISVDLGDDLAATDSSPSYGMFDTINSGAGIGGGYKGAGGTVTINGGTVVAISGSAGAQAIGHGEDAADSGRISFGDTRVGYVEENGEVHDWASSGAREDWCRSTDRLVRIEDCFPHKFDGASCTRCGAPTPTVSNVRARQRFPWNGLVDVDYEIGGTPKGFEAMIDFDEQGGRHWHATNFLAGAEPSAAKGSHRATWDAKAAGATNITAELTATVKLVSGSGIDLAGIPVFSGVSNCLATRDNSNFYLSDNAAVYAFLSNSFSTAEHSAANEIVFPNVSCFFSHDNGEDDGIDLSDEGRAVIKTFATFLSVTDLSNVSVLVEGYTCDLGSVSLRDECSQRRAENVKAELAKYIPASKVTAKWYGKRMFKKFKYDTKAEYDRVNIRIQ